MTLILALAFALAQPPATAQADATGELSRIEQQLATTWKHGDCAAWGAMLAEEWSVTHITGVVITKPEALRMCEAPAVPIEEFEIDDISVRLFGDAAVVTGRTRLVTGGVIPGRVTLRFTDVFIRQAGRWQVVASHATRLGS